MKIFEWIILIAMKIFEWIILIAVILVLWGIVIELLAGCASWSKPETPGPSTPGTQVISQVIHSTDWLMSILMIGVVAGLFAAFNGSPKLGFSGVVACIGGIVLKAALSSVYVYWLCGVLFIGCVFVAVASIFWKNKALKEIIIGTQNIKNDKMCPVKDQASINNTLMNAQSQSTQTLVQKIKSELKVKGIL